MAYSNRPNPIRMQPAREPLCDPTIPKKRARSGNAAQRARVEGPSEGRFVDMGGGVILLTDTRGNSWPQERVRSQFGSFGFSSEGCEKAPRPWKFDPAGNPLVEGDWYVIHFLDGDPQKPFVNGGVRSLKPADPDFLYPQPIGQDPNALRMRAALLNAAGIQTGHLQVKALDGGAKLEIVVGGGTYGVGVRIELDYQAGTIKLGKGAETHPIPLGDVYAQTIQKLAQDLIAVNAAIPTLAPTPVLNAPQILSDAATSLTADAPFLSKIARVE